MEFEEAREAVRHILQQYAGDCSSKAATIVAAALNDIAVAEGLIFRIERRTTIFDVAEEQKN